MRTLFLIAPSSRKDRSDLRSNRDPEVTGVSVIGTVLANRYKISERFDAESFKAHDVLLDQTVTVRQTNLTSERAGDVWRQKVEQLALVRDSKFLNVIDVISEESRDFVITEASRGQTVADLLAERQRPDWENVLRLMTSLAQPLELAAAYSCCPKAISTGWLFTGIMSPLPVDLDLRSHPEWPMLSIQLDVWELVKPGKNNALPLLTANAWSGGSTALAVRQAALLTYELLGGEKKRDGQVKRWFKPLNDLGEAGNSILYSGLQGSSLFENSESFLEKLGSAIRSGEPERRGSPAPALAIRAKNVLMPDANDVMRKFNRETRWVSTAIVAALVFASFSVAVLIPERYPKVNDFSSRRAERDLFPSSNPMYHLTPVGLNQQSSTLKTMPGESNGALMEISPPPNTSSQADADVPNPGRILESPREMNREDARGNADTGTSAHRREVGGVAGSKVLRARSRSSARPRFVSVKTRLLELWHQMESEKSHSWAPVANSNKADQKKVSYTAETNH
ncbi:MAG: hypothetical protein JO334_15905 [Verrucomicrobia bacterium]|nr:hypothetical protein [Verrucomicrobiota bacterium]